MPFRTSLKLAPDTSGKVAYLKYIYLVLFECSGCHLLSFETTIVLEPEKTPAFIGYGNAVLDDDFKTSKIQKCIHEYKVLDFEVEHKSIQKCNQGWRKAGWNYYKLSYTKISHINRS